MANLLRVRTVVQQTLAKQDAERTNHFLHAASSGDAAKIRQVGCKMSSLACRVHQKCCKPCARKPPTSCRPGSSCRVHCRDMAWSQPQQLCRLAEAAMHALPCWAFVTSA